MLFIYIILMLTLTIKHGKIIDVNNKKPSIYKELGVRQIYNKIRRLDRNIRVKFVIFLSSDYKIMKTESFNTNDFLEVMKNIPKAFK